MTIGASPVCRQCIHYHGNLTCKAFPEGIPDVVIMDGNDHTKPIEGDHGILFEGGVTK